MKRIKAGASIPVIAAVAALIIGLISLAYLETRATLAGKRAAAAQENTEAQVKIMRHVQSERQAGAMVARIRRLSRGLIRQAQAVEIVRILRAKCDESIKVETIMRMITRESGWDPQARGRHGEVGLLQLKPTTARLPAHVLTDPARNIEAGINHLRDLVEQTGSLPLALAAYNGGLYAGPIRYARAVIGERP